jgi:hypothetical protein
MAQHGIQNVLMQQDHGLAYAEVLKYTYQVSSAVLEESIRRIETQYDEADIDWNAAVSCILNAMDKLKIEILKK